MAKSPIELAWIEDLLPDEGWRRKSMFGGFAYYFEEKMILLTFEGAEPRWCGALFPVDKEFQAKALAAHPVLTPHSILPKWLFLPMQTEDFDEQVESILRDVLRPHSYWGTIPKAKKSSEKKKKADSAVSKAELKIDTRTPRMFSEESAEEVLKNAKKISDLKNLGTMTEKQFASIGLTSAQTYIKWGWKKTLKKLVEKNPKYRHSLFAYAMIGALTNTEFSRITDEEKAEARAFVKSLAPVKKKSPRKKISKN